MYQADKKETRNRNADRTKTEQIDDAENASKKATCLLPPALSEETPPISHDQLISALMSWYPVLAEAAFRPVGWVQVTSMRLPPEVMSLAP